jgi:hypothetical protein
VTWKPTECIHELLTRSCTIAAACRRLVLASNSATTTTTTLSRGLALFTLDASGRISSITDCPEHPVKLSARGLSVFGPLLAQGLNLPGAETLLPAMQELGRWVNILVAILSGIQGIGTLSVPATYHHPSPPTASLGLLPLSCTYTTLGLCVCGPLLTQCLDLSGPASGPHLLPCRH